MHTQLREYCVREILKEINALHSSYHVKDTAILCAQVSLLFKRHRYLLGFLEFHESTFSKLLVIGAKCLTCWPPSLIETLKDQMELLYECTAHETSFLEEAAEKEEFCGKKQKNALHYLRHHGNRDPKGRKASRQQALSELARRFAPFDASAKPEGK